MKISLIASALLITSMTFQGCGSDSKEDTSSSSKTLDQVIFEESSDSILDSIKDMFSSDSDSSVTSSEERTQELDTILIELANSTSSVEEFTKKALDITVTYVVNEYAFFDVAKDYLLDDDWEYENQTNLTLSEYIYLSSATLVEYLGEYYDEATNGGFFAPARGIFSDSTSDILDKIIDELYNILLELASQYSFESLWDSLFPTPDVVLPPEDGTYVKIDPNQNFQFTSDDINAKKYFVASEQYMTVTFTEDGLSGYGDIGYGIGADFTSDISGEKLFITMNDIVYELEMTYRDPDYCIATEMLDTKNGIKYPAYWFTNEAVYKEASNVSTAEALCHIHSTDYVIKEIAKDGVLEAIADEREGNLPVSGTTSEIVNTLVDGVDNSADVTDAKYFARKMRHGVFSIYTTNGQTHTLQATENEKITRELLPLAASSALGMQELMNGAYDTSVAFQDEVNRDLNDSVTEVNARLDALIVATSQAMDATTSENSYHGVAETKYGDIVDFKATNIQSACGLAFFLCNTATADITMTITNPEDNGRVADVLFTTEIETSIVGNSAVDFSEVDAGQANNYIGGSDYNLNISNFNYQRSNGLMTIKGDGFLGNDSKLTIDTYDIVATFSEEPELKLLNFSATLDGLVTTTAGRDFVGSLVFDGDNTDNSKMDGTLIGINNEPKIVGVIRTSLSSEEITEWVATHDTISTQDAGDLDNIGDQSYSMDVVVSRDDKQVSADMLVKRDTSKDTWTYLMKDLSVSDKNGNMIASKIYLIQKGANTLAQTLEKVAMDGVSLDSDMNTLINIGWNVASDFDEIGIEGLQVTMKPESGDVIIKSTINVLNNATKMSATMQSSYDFATTHINSDGNFSTLVTEENGKNVYTNTFAVDGSIIVDDLFNYKYAIDYTDLEQLILFTRKDSNYQMGFKLSEDGVVGGDSYGVLADFVMNDTYDVLESMQVKDNSGNELGDYNRSVNKLQIEFTDGVKEYMYLY
jgi:hypothetical protein